MKERTVLKTGDKVEVWAVPEANSLFSVINRLVREFLSNCSYLAEDVSGTGRRKNHAF